MQPNNKGFALVLVLVIVLVIATIGIFGYSSFFTTNKTSDSTNADSALKSIFSDIENIYGGSLPWSSINNKQAFQFYPKEIKGLLPTLDYTGSSRAPKYLTSTISVNHDNNYNPITVFNLIETVSVPLKNSYVGHYTVPNILKSKFGLNEDETAAPVELKVYEFDRKISANEMSHVINGEILNCTNDSAETEKLSFSNQYIVMHHCKLNLTNEQIAQLTETDLYDQIYAIYFSDRNLLLQFGIDSKSINNYQDYLTEYLTKLFNSNEALFINQNQIISLEESRQFREVIRQLYSR